MPERVEARPPEAQSIPKPSSTSLNVYTAKMYGTPRPVIYDVNVQLPILQTLRGPNPPTNRKTAESRTTPLIVDKTDLDADLSYRPENAIHLESLKAKHD